MPQSHEESKDKNSRSLQRPRNSSVSKNQDNGEQSNKIGNLDKQEASEIVAQAYEEAARIIAEAEQKAKSINGQTGDRGITTSPYLSDLIKSGSITNKSYEKIDDLFIQVRHHLAEEAKTESVRAEELGGLIVQLEYWVESLVADSLKLRSIKRWLQGATELARKLAG